jgi:multiple antibiotic resistance protein
MWEFIKVLPNTFIPLFVAIDVTATLPIFLSLTHAMTDSEKRSVTRQSTFTALAVSLVFVVVGEAVFSILGITVNDFKIAGGLILLVLAILELMKDTEEGKRPTGTIGVVPIGVPLIVGPAVLTTLIVLINHYGIVPTTISLILNFIIVWFALTNAQKIIEIFGKNGIAALSKIMALLLAAIAVMMIRLGVEGILK